MLLLLTNNNNNNGNGNSPGVDFQGGQISYLQPSIHNVPMPDDDAVMQKQTDVINRIMIVCFHQKSTKEIYYASPDQNTEKSSRQAKESPPLYAD